MASNLENIRKALYLTQRTIGDYQAATRGPAPLAKRLIRRQIRRRTGPVLGRWGL